MTKQYTKIIKKEVLDQSVELAKNELLVLIESLFCGNLTFMYRDKICTATPLDFHRLLLEWKRKTRVDNFVKQIIVSFFFSAEEKMIGTGLLSCADWLGIKKNEEKKEKLSKKDIFELVDNWAPSGISNTISKKSFLAGALGSEVILEESENSCSEIKTIDGKSIEGTIDNIFQCKNNLSNFQDKCFIVAIDGIVESVSQLEQLFVKHGQEKIILAARGFLPDVSNTISENYFNKNLKIIPFVVSDWKVKNFLDLENSNISCISSEIGSDIRKINILETNQILITKNEIVYSNKKEVSERKIKVLFGKDLSSLKGISLDRTKMLLALMRFASRQGIRKVKLGNCQMFFPENSIKYADMSTKSLNNILQNLGAIVINEKRNKNVQ